MSPQAWIPPPVSRVQYRSCMVLMYQRFVDQSNSSWNVSWSEISSWLAVTSTPKTIKKKRKWMMWKLHRKQSEGDVVNFCIEFVKKTHFTKIFSINSASGRRRADRKSITVVSHQRTSTYTRKRVNLGSSQG